jgi:hypothetical protein
MSAIAQPLDAPRVAPGPMVVDSAAEEGARGWIEANQRRLVAGLAELRLLLEAHAARGARRTGTLTAAASDGGALEAMSQPAALEAIGDAFGLSAFERQALLLCAAPELDPSFGPLCADAQGDPQRPFPTFSLCLAALPEAHWSAVAAQSPLRFWRLIEVGHGETLVGSQMRIDEWVLAYLTGLPDTDERLWPLTRPVEPPAQLPTSQQSVADELEALWKLGQEASVGIAQLCASDAGACRAVAGAAAARASRRLSAMRAADTPVDVSERELFARLWQRQFVLGGPLLVVENHEADDGARDRAADLVRRLGPSSLVAGREPLRVAGVGQLRLDVPPPTYTEQLESWRNALGASGDQLLTGALELIAAHFRLGTEAMATAAAQAAAQSVGRAGAEGEELAALLWDACRDQVRPRLDDLAQRIEPVAGWDELVLPPAQKETLRQIAASVAQRATVYERWGFGSRGNRGLGISALFAGASGTGKTMAAEVLGNELRLDVYRIDLSQVVSKYIGETEKNLARAFDAAEEGGAVLLFDEADALFGKRSEVKDSHDRYANIEVSYLLQRMEAYRGLAILTTNMKAALDPAFLRRIRFVVQFPFPDAMQRAEIWRRVFPAATPTQNLRPEQLAKLNLAGGNIRNVAVNAAFLAAAAGRPVSMADIRRAAQAEYSKLEKPLTEAEVAGWQ